MNKEISEKNGISNRGATATDKKPLQPPVGTSRDLSAKEYVHPVLAQNDIRDTLRNYRKAVKAYNEKIKPKGKAQPIKPRSVLVFEAILWEYAMQLFKRKEVRVELDVNVPGKLPDLKLVPGWMATANKKGFLPHPLCQKTFRSHRKRLEEAGIIQDHKYEGSARPVKLKINPQILAITDYCPNSKTTH